MRNGSAGPCPPRFVAFSHLPTSTSAKILASPRRTINRYRLVNWGNRHSPSASSLNPDCSWQPNDQRSPAATWAWANGRLVQRVLGSESLLDLDEHARECGKRELMKSHKVHQRSSLPARGAFHKELHTVVAQRAQRSLAFKRPMRGT